MWDAMVDAWAIAAGVIEPPGTPPTELEHAASVLLALPVVGLMGPFDGLQAWRLKAAGGAPERGIRAVPGVKHVRVGCTRDEGCTGCGSCTWVTDTTEREQFFRTVFGARKRVIEEAGLPAKGLGALPKPWITPPGAQEAPPAATARRLAAWCRTRDIPCEVLEGPLAGDDLTEWDPGVLAAADEELAERGLLVRLYTVRGGTIRLRVPPGRDNWKTAASCQSPRSQCETWCPLFGMRVCAKYEIGVGRVS